MMKGDISMAKVFLSVGRAGKFTIAHIKLDGPYIRRTGGKSEALGISILSPEDTDNPEYGEDLAVGRAFRKLYAGLEEVDKDTLEGGLI